MAGSVRFRLNGEAVKLAVDPDRVLLWVLRADLGLTGTKYGCGASLCGACTVLVNGEAVRSCQRPMRTIEGAEVLTIEGLAREGRLHPVQQAFIEHDALQCGYCTPGMIMGAHALLSKTPSPSIGEIVKQMEGHLCRCAGYDRVIRAIQSASRAMKGGGA